MRGELRQMELTVQDIADWIEGRLREVVVVSDRWVSPHNPYVGTHKTGEQLEAIRAFLRKHTEILYVWFDFGCLSQREEDSSGGVLKDLNLAEEAYFGHALSRVNLLYLSAKVLILLDGEHITRFWCVYETFLSGHEFDGTASVEEKSEAGVWRSVDITCVGSSAKEDEDTHEDLKTMHMKRLCRIPVKNFIEKMRSEDIKATDGGDKDEQFKMLDGFADTMTTFQEAVPFRLETCFAGVVSRGSETNACAVAWADVGGATPPRSLALCQAAGVSIAPVLGHRKTPTPPAASPTHALDTWHRTVCTDSLCLRCVSKVQWEARWSE